MHGRLCLVLLTLLCLAPAASAFSVDLAGGALYVEAKPVEFTPGYTGVGLQGVIGSNVAPVNTTYIVYCAAALPTDAAIAFCPVEQTDGTVNGEHLTSLAACIGAVVADPNNAGIALCPYIIVALGDPQNPDAIILANIVIVQQNADGSISGLGCFIDTVQQDHEWIAYPCVLVDADPNAGCLSTESYSVSREVPKGDDSTTLTCASSTDDGSGDCLQSSATGDARSACAGAQVTQSTNSICAYAEASVDQPPSPIELVCVGTNAQRSTGFGPSVSVLGRDVLP